MGAECIRGWISASGGAAGPPLSGKPQDGALRVACWRPNGGCTSARLFRLGVTGDDRSNRVHPSRIQIMATLGKTEEPDVTKKTEDYSGSMQQAMGTGLTYRHELGMNYAHVLPDLIVGSCLQTPADVDRLNAAGVKTIFCLQQDPDLAYFSVDIGAIQNRAAQVEGIEHFRAQIRDFDAHDLRVRLPKVVAMLYKVAKRNGGTAYVHCTAGLGRAPAVALTYMYWIRGYDLLEANAMLQRVRHCHPKLDSIKAATADILTGAATKKVFLSWKRGADQSVEISGLDVGWGEAVGFDFAICPGEVLQRIALQKGDNSNWYLERDVPIGRYEFKYIVDGTWTNNPDIPETQPNRDGHVNNYIEVSGGSADSEVWQFRKQIMADDFVLTEEHRKTIRERLESLPEE